MRFDYECKLPQIMKIGNTDNNDESLPITGKTVEIKDIGSTLNAEQFNLLPQ